MEPEHKEMSVEALKQEKAELNQLSEKMKNVPHYNILRFGMLFWLVFTLVMLGVHFFFDVADDKDIKALRADIQLAKNTISDLQTNVLTLSEYVSELQAELQAAQDDSRVENVFLPSVYPNEMVQDIFKSKLQQLRRLINSISNR